MPEATFLHGDCLEVLPTLPKGSVDMIFCDLPYGEVQCPWDIIVDMQSLWPLLRQVGRKSATFVCSATQPFATTLISSNIEMFKHETIWIKEKSAMFAVAKYRPMAIHEGIYVFGSSITYNPQKIKLEKPYTVTRKKKELAAFRGMDRSGVYRYTHRYPTSVLHINRESANSGLHFTQKPVQLLRYLIRTYSNPGDTILDPTAGSGTTAVAALLEGRHSISIEKDPTIFANAKERVMAVQRSLTPRRAEG
jgi:site-specific DNA-methyltransferase (adenine-specific)